MTKTTKTAKAPKKSASKTTKRVAAARKADSKKVSAKKNGNGQKAPKVSKHAALHERLISLMSRPTGATVSDFTKAGYKYPAMQALKIAERRGLKVSTKKPEGELTNYYAKR